MRPGRPRSQSCRKPCPAVRLPIFFFVIAFPVSSALASAWPDGAALSVEAPSRITSGELLPLKLEYQLPDSKAAYAEFEIAVTHASTGTVVKHGRSHSLLESPGPGGFVERLVNIPWYPDDSRSGIRCPDTPSGREQGWCELEIAVYFTSPWGGFRGETTVSVLSKPTDEMLQLSAPDAVPAGAELEYEVRFEPGPPQPGVEFEGRTLAVRLRDAGGNSVVPAAVHRLEDHVTGGVERLTIAGSLSPAPCPDLPQSCEYVLEAEWKEVGKVSQAVSIVQPEIENRNIDLVVPESVGLGEALQFEATVAKSSGLPADGIWAELIEPAAGWVHDKRRLATVRFDGNGARQARGEFAAECLDALPAAANAPADSPLVCKLMVLVQVPGVGRAARAVAVRPTIEARIPDSHISIEAPSEAVFGDTVDYAVVLSSMPAEKKSGDGRVLLEVLDRYGTRLHGRVLASTRTLRDDVASRWPRSFRAECPRSQQQCQLVLRVTVDGLGQAATPLTVRHPYAGRPIELEAPARAYVRHTLRYKVWSRGGPDRISPFLPLEVLLADDNGQPFDRQTLHAPAPGEAVSGEFRTRCPGDRPACRLMLIARAGHDAGPAREVPVWSDHAAVNVEGWTPFDLDVPREAILRRPLEFTVGLTRMAETGLEHNGVPYTIGNAVLLDGSGEVMSRKNFGPVMPGQPFRGWLPPPDCPGARLTCSVTLRIDLQGYQSMWQEISVRPATGNDRISSDFSDADLSKYFDLPRKEIRASLERLRDEFPASYYRLIHDMGRIDGPFGVDATFGEGNDFCGTATPLPKNAKVAPAPPECSNEWKFFASLRTRHPAFHDLLVHTGIHRDAYTKSLAYRNLCQPWVLPGHLEQPEVLKGHGQVVPFLSRPRVPVDCLDYSPPWRRLLEDLAWRAMAPGGGFVLNDTDEARFWPADEKNPRQRYVHGYHNYRKVFYARPAAGADLTPLDDRALAQATDNPLAAAVMHVMLLNRLFRMSELWYLELMTDSRRNNGHAITNRPAAFPAEMEILNLLADRLEWMAREGKLAMQQAYEEWQDADRRCEVYYSYMWTEFCDFNSGARSMNNLHFDLDKVTQRSNKLLLERQKRWPINEAAMVTTSSLLELFQVAATTAHVVDVLQEMTGKMPQPSAELLGTIVGDMLAGPAEPFTEDVRKAIDVLLMAAGEDPVDWTTVDWDTLEEELELDLHALLAVKDNPEQVEEEGRRIIDKLKGARGGISPYTRFMWLMGVLERTDPALARRLRILAAGKFVDLSYGGASITFAASSILGIATAALQFENARGGIDYARAALDLVSSTNYVLNEAGYMAQQALHAAKATVLSNKLGAGSGVAWGVASVAAIASGILIMIQDHDPVSIASGTAAIATGAADLISAGAIIWGAAHNITAASAGNAAAVGAAAGKAVIAGGGSATASLISGMMNGVVLGIAVATMLITNALDTLGKAEDFREEAYAPVRIEAVDVLRMLSAKDPMLLGRVYLAMHLAR